MKNLPSVASSEADRILPEEAYDHARCSQISVMKNCNVP